MPRCQYAGDSASDTRPAGGSAMVAASGHRRAVTARAVAVIAVIAVAAGAVWAIAAERAAIRGGFGVFGHARLWWVGAAVVAQGVSMTAFVLSQRRLLRAVGGRLPLSWLLSTAHLANAIALAVPFAGSGMATGFAYRRFRRAGADPAAAALVLTLAGIFSTVAFAVVMARAGSALSGPPFGCCGCCRNSCVAPGPIPVWLCERRGTRQRGHRGFGFHVGVAELDR